VHIFRGASDRALIYTDADFEYRTLLFYEADSIPEDGPGASALRSLLSDNKMEYEVSIRTPDGKWGTQKICKEGPTQFMTTSTKSLPHQMNTRTLEITLSDRSDQTHAIFHAHARAANPNPERARLDLSPYLALQDWLTLYGERRIAVPFAGVLADLVPPTAVRARRDFKQLLTVIKVLAFLRQQQRERTPEGWVIATHDDYGEARRLLAPIFDAAAADGVTPAIRETVEAVGLEEAGISQSQIAKRLGVARNVASYRINRALHLGFLVDEETKAVKGRASKLRRGEPLPDEITGLPSVAQLRRVSKLP
jgi:hypothetical protein